MARTSQQQAVIDAVKDPSSHLVKCKAVAGSGKTFTLVELAKDLPDVKGLYLAYNKAIADEATTKFKGTGIKCSTIHSLAYSYTVRQLGLRVGFFNYRAIKERIPYKRKLQLVKSVEQFCLSSYINPAEYAEKHVDKVLHKYFINYLDQMADGTIQCTHSFYLKMFHVYLATGDIEVPETDLLLMDEAGDITELTLAIFLLLKAKTKVAVGDPMQNIYSFNNTINAFTALKGKGVDVGLTESFRVSSPIAKHISKFVKKHCEEDFKFKGHKYPEDVTVETKCYIARNNTGLLERMVELYQSDISFTTTRSIDTILKLPIILANLNNKCKITDYEYKHIEDLRAEFENTRSLQNSHKSASSYVRAELSNDEEVSQAFKVVNNYGPKMLNDIVAFVKENNKSECHLTLTTAHSSKGLEFSEVEIAPDLNRAVRKALVTLSTLKKWSQEYYSSQALEELRLYYVATSRAMLRLVNAELYSNQPIY